MWLIAHLQQGGIETPPLEFLLGGAEALVDVASTEPLLEGC